MQDDPDDTQERRTRSYTPGNRPPPGGELWRYVAWIVLVTLLIGFFFQPAGDPDRVDLRYSEFKAQLRDGQVEAVTLRGQEILGRLSSATSPAGTEASSERFRTMRPPVADPELMRLLEQNNVGIEVQASEPPWLLRALINILPWVLLIGLVVYFLRRMQKQMAGGGGGGLFQIGKSKAQRYREGITNVGFGEVAGLDNAKRDLGDIVTYLKEPERLRRLGAKPPRGVLMTGQPGTGKTMLARAVAGEAGVPFYSMTASEFMEMFVGVGASRVRDTFQNAKDEAPAIIFIDEIDAIGRTRGGGGVGGGGGQDEREQTLNQILNEMDGFTGHEAVVVLAATNRPDVLDPALTRPGRFDRRVVLDLPHRDARRAILAVHTRDTPLAEDVDLDELAARTVGFSGADLENLVNEAGLLAAREDRERIDAATLDQARDKVLLGAEREAMLPAEEKERVAYHESGHALLTCLLERTDPVAKVTIVPRGRALGATEQVPEDRYNLLESDLRDRITAMFGGRVAERIVYGEVSSGAQDDLQQATQLVRRMVSQWGMNEEVGAVGYRQGDDPLPMGAQRDYSERTAELIDAEVRRLTTELEQRAETLVSGHRDRLEALARTLLEHEVLQAEEIRRIAGIAEAPDGDATTGEQAPRSAAD